MSKKENTDKLDFRKLKDFCAKKGHEEDKYPSCWTLPCGLQRYQRELSAATGMRYLCFAGGKVQDQ